MTYEQANEKLTGRNSDRRKLANNTYLERREHGKIAVKLHGTDVVVFQPDGKAFANSGGWRTITTKARINEYLPNGRIHQQGGIWYWHNGQPFRDGDAVPTGEYVANGDTTVKDQKALRRKVNAYAKLYGQNLPLAKPSAGDCWYCCLRSQDGDTMGDAFKSTDHLLSHIEEGYVVPSLAYNALKEGKCGDLIFHCVFNEPIGADIGPTYVVRAVRKYMFKRLQMPS